MISPFVISSVISLSLSGPIIENIEEIMANIRAGIISGKLSFYVC